MIMVRAPLRISFVGGGSDLPGFCDKEDGYVVSATIKHSVHVMADLRPDGCIRLVYSRTERVPKISDLEHDIARETLKLLASEHSIIERGIEILSVGDLPERMGLGSSGAYTVALVQAVSALSNQHYSSRALAQRASYVEMSLCGRPVGYQDQTASAHGGVKLYKFNHHGEEEIEDLYRYSFDLERRVLMVDIGPREADSTTLKDLSDRMDDTRSRSTLRSMANMALAFRDALVAGKIDNCGEILEGAWMLKRTLGGTSSEEADKMYKFAKSNGAIGGKVCGAGGHGMMVFICRAGVRNHLHRKIMESYPRNRVVVPGFINTGSRIVYSS